MKFEVTSTSLSAAEILLDDKPINLCQGYSITHDAQKAPTVEIKLVPQKTKIVTICEDLYIEVGERRFKVIEEEYY
jgi:DNA-directed RNA polymerase subunit L